MNINLSNYEAWFLDYTEGRLTPEQVAEVLLFVEMHPELKSEFESFEIITLEDDSTSFTGKDKLHKPVLSIDQNNYEEFFIAYSEGMLSPEEKSAVEKFASSSPALLKELNAFLYVRLQEDKFVNDEKTFLKKGFFPFAKEEKDFWMIAYIEDRLDANQKQEFLTALAGDPSLQAELNAYNRTKLSVDSSIVYDDKEGLKKGGKVVGINWRRFVSYAAAACLLLFFLPKNDPTSNDEYAEVKTEKDTSRINPSNNIIPDENKNVNFASVEEENSSSNNNTVMKENRNYDVAVVEKKNDREKKEIKNENIVNKKDSVSVIPVNIPDLTPQNEVVVDSNKTNNNIESTNEDVAMNSNRSNNNAEYSTIGKFIKKTINKKVFSEDEQKDATTSKEKSTKIGNVPVSYQSDKKEEYSAYGVSIGSFSFSRSVTK